MRKKLSSNIAMLMVFGLCLLAACSRFTSTGSQPTVGQPVDNFTLNDLNGKPFSMADQKGKVVLINVFTTW